jgi:WD40 repeat protein
VAFSPTGNLLATGSYDESAIVWDVKRGRVLRVLPAHAEAVWCVNWDREGGVVMTASADGLMWVAQTWVIIPRDQMPMDNENLQKMGDELMIDAFGMLTADNVYGL